MAKKNTAPKQDKPPLTAEEKLAVRKARLATEAAKIAAADKALTAKVVKRQEQEEELAEARLDADDAYHECVAADATAYEKRQTMNAANARVRHLETALGLRKRGQAPVEEKPAEGAATPQGATSGPGEPDD